MATEQDLAGVTIVFDLDGTLVDTAPDLVRALNQTLDLEGLPHVPLGALRHLVGRGARALIERASSMAEAHFSNERLDQLTNAFVDFYRADIAGESVPFPGVENALCALADAGATLAVCTNKRTELSRLLLETLALAERFGAIVGADAVAHRNPHPDHFTETVARVGGDVKRSLMVGDSTADIEAAHGAGAPAIVVRFGYFDVAPEEMGADALLSHFDDLGLVARRVLATRNERPLRV